MRLLHRILHELVHGLEWVHDGCALLITPRVGFPPHHVEKFLGGLNAINDKIISRNAGLTFWHFSIWRSRCSR